MTVREAIEGFEIDNGLLNGKEDGTVERNNMAIKALELMDSYRWIPMEERPPEEDAVYLVTMVTSGFLNGKPYTNWLCWCCKDQEWTYIDGAALPEQDKIIAWWPILEPYWPEN